MRLAVFCLLRILILPFRRLDVLFLLRKKLGFAGKVGRRLFLGGAQIIV